MLKRAITYARNKRHAVVFAVNLHLQGPKKVKNWPAFRDAFRDRTDALHQIDFSEGYSLSVRGRDLNGVAEACIFEDYTRDLFIHPGMVVYDLGSCVGDFAILAAWRGAEVFAFEPDKDNFALLERNIALNGLTGRITALNIAIDAVPGHVNLDTSSENTGGYTLSDTGTARVPALTVEQIMTTYGHERIHLLKIDVEGSEYRIFADPSSAALNNIDMIVGEYHLDIKRSDYKWSNLKIKLREHFAHIHRRAPYYFVARN